MQFLPLSSNDQYRGKIWAAWLLTLFSILTIIPGAWHVFSSDGGANSIAGFDITQNTQLIITSFAWAGSTQIVWGIMMLTISLRYRALTAFIITLILIERILIASTIWYFKIPSDTHQPPEAYITLFILPVIILALYGALCNVKLIKDL